MTSISYKRCVTYAWGKRIAKILTVIISVGGSEWVSIFLLCVFLNILYLLLEKKNSCDC